MKSINFNEGLHEYKINGDEDRVIRLRLEPNMVGRLEKMTDKLEDMIKSCPEKPSLEQFAEIGDKLCVLINEAFNADICGPAFGGANPLTPVSDGKPLFQAFLESFVPVVTEDIKKITQNSKKVQPETVRPEVQKYIGTGKPYMANPFESTVPDISTLSKEQKAQLIAQLLS